MSQYPDCYESSNVICKHVRADITVYVNLNDRLAAGVRVITATAESEDESLVIGSPEVLGDDLVLEQASSCGGITLLAEKSLLFTVSGGAPAEVDSNGNEIETIITVGFVTSDGQQDFVDCRLLLGGSP